MTGTNEGGDRLHILVEHDQSGSRLDALLATHPGVPSRSFAQLLISRGLVEVDGTAAGKNYRVKEGQSVSFQMPASEVSDVIPEEIPLNIVYEDEDLAVISKPAGMVTHPAAGHVKGTLVNALLFHLAKLSGIGGVQRPGIIHRLDKDTSGLLIVAKNDKSHMALAGQLKRREIKRSYLALVRGAWKVDTGVIDAPIGRGAKDRKRMTIAGHGSRKAITRFKVLERFAGYCLLDVQLETGRTHQIRVHMAYARHPIAGDKEYGARSEYPGSGFSADSELSRQFLHAYRLEFNQPRTGKHLVFEDSLPEDLESVLEKLRAAIDDGGRTS